MPKTWHKRAAFQALRPCHHWQVLEKMHDVAPSAAPQSGMRRNGKNAADFGHSTGECGKTVSARIAKRLTGDLKWWMIASNMEDDSGSLNQRIAHRVRELRREQNCSLQDLAERSGVSRSMISLIERAESSPTAVVLEKLAAGLNVTLASFFERPVLSSQRRDHPVSRRNEQPEWRDPASGYRRRNVSPAGVQQPLQITEVHFPPGARVAFENGLRDRPVYQQVWMLEGVIDITVGTERHRLCEGDCLAMQLDAATIFHNPTEETARYAVVIAADHLRRRP